MAVAALTPVRARVVQGHRVASGRCGDPRFPDGTIAPQLPLFRARVAEFDAYLGAAAFPGTINLRVDGLVAPLRPEIVIPGLRWSAQAPAETFFLSRAALDHAGRRHPVYLYMPDPATKPDHHQPAGTIELLAARIDGLAYGDAVVLHHRPEAILIRPAG